MEIFSSLDIPTLFCLMSLADITVCLLLLGYGDEGQHVRELRGFVAARTLHGLACLSIGFAAALPVFWGLVLPTAAVFFGFALEGGTIARLRGANHLSRLVPYGLAVAGSLLLLVVSGNGALLVGVASGIISLLFVYMCLALVIRPGRTRLVWMMLAIFAANVVASLLRAYGGLFSGAVISDKNWLQLIGLLTSYTYCVGGGVGFLLLLKEETDRKLRRDASTDSLTGLLNHRAFFAAARERLEAAPSGVPFAFLSLDLDHFKQVNDTYGHPAGDELLRQVGARLIAHFDGTCLIGRVGGEEFAALLTSPSDAALEKAEGLRQSMMTIRLPDCVDHAFTASIGVAVTQGRARESLQALVRRCDHALYEAKHGGRNRIVVAKPEGTVAAPNEVAAVVRERATPCAV